MTARGTLVMVELEESRNLVFKCAMQDHQALWEQKKAKILEQLSLQEAERLFAHSLRYTKLRGELLYLSDSEVPRVYILDRGYVRFCRITDDGDRLITGFLGPADVFGSVFPGSRPEEDFIEVVREARIIAIEADVFKAVLEKHASFLLRLVEILEGRQKRLEKRIISMATKDVYAQTAEILLELSEKFGENCLEDPDESKDISLTHQEIADLVGVARPTVSKVISEMLKAGLLRKHHQHLCIYRQQGLHLVAEQGQIGLDR